MWQADVRNSQSESQEHHIHPPLVPVSQLNKGHENPPKIWSIFVGDEGEERDTEALPPLEELLKLCAESKDQARKWQLMPETRVSRERSRMQLLRILLKIVLILPGATQFFVVSAHELIMWPVSIFSQVSQIFILSFKQRTQRRLKTPWRDDRLRSCSDVVGFQILPCPVVQIRSFQIAVYVASLSNLWTSVWRCYGETIVCFDQLP